MDKGHWWSKVMYQCASKAPCSHSGLDGLDWEGLRDSCLVTTNLLKCLTNIKQGLYFWPWIVKSAFYCNLTWPWTPCNMLCDTWYICHDSLKTNVAIMVVHVYVLSETCGFNDSPVASVLIVVYAGSLPLLVLCCRLCPGCFSYSGLSLYNPHSHAKIQAVSNESSVPAVYFRKKKNRIKAQCFIKPYLSRRRLRMWKVAVAVGLWWQRRRFRRERAIYTMKGKKAFLK